LSKLFNTVYFTVEEVKYPFAMPGDVFFMGYLDNGYPHFPVQSPENGHDDFTGARIKGAGGFVGEKDFGFSDYGSGDGHPLLFSARKLGWQVMEPVFKTYGLQSPDSPAPAFFASYTPVNERQFYVGLSIQIRQKVESLKYKPYEVIADIGQLAVAQFFHPPAGDFIRACRGLVQAAHDIEKGGLSRARRPHYGDEVSFFNTQINILKGFNHHLPVSVHPGYAF
jgi:hypothetical protein